MLVINHNRNYVAAILLIATILLCWVNCSKNNTISQSGSEPNRIVSFAPSITETLFALGLGERVVGVTSYCRFPPQADSIEEIGGYTDANLEKIITLKPDLVILQRDHEKHRAYLDRYGIKTLSVNYGSINEICTSFAAIGRVSGAEHQSDSLIKQLQMLMNKNLSNIIQPKVLLCVGRESPGGGSVQTIFAAGTGTYYNDLIRAAGGINVYNDSIPHYPRISLEGIITLAPDIIIDVAPAMGPYECSTLVKDWQSVNMVPAVQNDQVHCLSADYATIPGPRVLLLFNDLKQILKRQEL